LTDHLCERACRGHYDRRQRKRPPVVQFPRCSASLAQAVR
jgi:hypothetical protein